MSEHPQLFAPPEAADNRQPWQRSVRDGGYDLSRMVRHTDPSTSVAAAKKAKPKADTLRALVYAEIASSDGMTHDELIAALPDWSASGVRTRCRELVDAGRVHAAGTRTSALGNKAIVWRAS